MLAASAREQSSSACAVDIDIQQASSMGLIELAQPSIVAEKTQCSMPPPKHAPGRVGCRRASARSPAPAASRASLSRVRRRTRARNSSPRRPRRAGARQMSAYVEVGRVQASAGRRAQLIRRSAAPAAAARAGAQNRGCCCEERAPLNSGGTFIASVSRPSNRQRHVRGSSDRVAIDGRRFAASAQTHPHRASRDDQGRRRAGPAALSRLYGARATIG